MRWNLRWGVTGLIVGLVGWLGVMAVWPERDPWPPRSVIALPADCRVLGFSADGRSFQVETGKSISAWDLATGRRTERVPAAWIDQKRFSQDRRMFVGVIVDHFKQKGIAVGDTATEAIRTRFPLGSRWAYRVDLVDDDRKVRAVVGQRNAPIEVVTWDLATGAETRRPLTGPKKGGGGEAWPAGVSRDGRVLAFLDLARDGVQLWDAETDQPLGGLLRTPSTQLVQSYDSAAFTPGDDRLIISRADGAVEVWNLADRRWLRTIPIHPAGHVAIGLQIAPDGRTLASSRFHHAGPSWASRFWSGLAKPLGVSLTNQGRSDEVVVVDLQTGARLARWPGSFQPKFSPDGRTVVTHESWLGTFAIRDTPRPPAR